MAKKSHQSVGDLETDDSNGLLAGLFAEENALDGRALWRIGSWGVVAVGAMVLAVYANQTSLGWRRDQIAADDLARQAQQFRQLAREGQVETRKLASAVDTLNGDRDRLFSRVTVLEQGLDSVTGAIARQAAAAAKPVTALSAPDAPPAQANPAAAPTPMPGPVATAPPATAPAVPPEKPRTEAARSEPPVAVAAAVPAPKPVAPPPAPLIASKSMLAPPDPAAPKLIEAAKPPAPAPAPPDTAVTPPPETVASLPAIEPKAEDTDEPKAAAVQRTEFALDLGSANSIGGLRALWRGVLASNASLGALNPIIMVRENKTGLGMQLRLGAGPLQDAATAAKICAALAEARRGCETAVFDGQRLAMAPGEVQPLPGAKPEIPMVKAAPGRRTWTRHAKKEEPPQKLDKSSISSWFGGKKP